MFDLFKTNVVMKLKQHVKENIVNVLSLNSAVTMESVSLRDGVVIMKTVIIAVLLLHNIIFHIKISIILISSSSSFTNSTDCGDSR